MRGSRQSGMTGKCLRLLFDLIIYYLRVGSDFFGEVLNIIND